ncbi:ABC transporter ATP-binding protein [endosymbiont GvMRE of Glomus versiforme]|uniref:ABC transporter ATP-binding protein n=1 Tax=endosymbiont GvMRE of Glomus versiforme TaxID=2039283 RepID=UPI000EE134B7|nr:ATP-binding cassette domain-containing protein [endosymbiont GvMRE of Glomus versiforme]RHZ35438.1 ABC transporter ATP-binding protein [endosymbiont GvMRE of Glomus versiforme]
MIEAKQISKKYDSKRILKKISFVVRAGTIHGFVGPNGSGKSTFLNILVRLVLPDGGEAYIEKRLVQQEPFFNEHLGYVPAEAKFPPEMTVKEYILDRGYLRDISTTEVLRKISISSLARFLDCNCNELSTGWKKILQLFILKLYKPAIILLDEPFNGLDPTFRYELLNNLKNIRANGKTILISTHILSDLQKLADDITMINNGKIIYIDPKNSDIEIAYKNIFVNEERRENFELL